MSQEAYSREEKKSRLRIIGQDMHIMNPVFFRAVEKQDYRSLAAMAEQQIRAGADALDLNFGPAKKNIALLDRAVQSLQEAVQVPLFIAFQVLFRPEVLKLHQGRAVINSVTADPALLADAMQRAGEYGAELVVLLVRPGLIPLTADDRLRVAGEVLETAEQTEFPLSRLYLDPLFHLKPDPAVWKLGRRLPDIDSVLETIALLPLLSRKPVRTLVALSSASQFLPATERAAFHYRLLPLLRAAGLDAVLINCNDKKLMKIARNPDTAEEPRPFSPPQTEAIPTAVVLPG